MLESILGLTYELEEETYLGGRFQVLQPSAPKESILVVSSKAHAPRQYCNFM